MVRSEDYITTVILFLICIALLAILIYILEKRINKLYTIIKTLTIFGFQNEWLYLTLFGIPKECVFKGVKNQLKDNNLEMNIPDYILKE